MSQDTFSFEIGQKKRDLRLSAEINRAKEFKTKPNAAFLVRDIFIHQIEIPSESVIAGYSAQGSELDPHQLMISLEAKGHKLALPVIKGKNEPLLFRRYKIGDELRRGPMKIWEPKDEAEVCQPDIILVPLLAFDKEGYRLGYGGGYYDRTLNTLRQCKQILAIGVAYTGQELELLPRVDTDARLDKLVTELKVLTPP